MLQISTVLSKLGVAVVPTIAEARKLNLSVLNNEEKAVLLEAINAKNTAKQAEFSQVATRTRTREEHPVGEGNFSSVTLEVDPAREKTADEHLADTYVRIFGTDEVVKTSGKGNTRTEKAQVVITFFPNYVGVERLSVDKAGIVWKKPTNESWMLVKEDGSESVDIEKFKFDMVCDLDLVDDPKVWAESITVYDGLDGYDLASYAEAFVAEHISRPVTFLLKSDKYGNLSLISSCWQNKTKAFIL